MIAPRIRSVLSPNGSLGIVAVDRVHAIHHTYEIPRQVAKAAAEVEYLLGLSTTSETSVVNSPSLRPPAPSGASSPIDAERVIMVDEGANEESHLVAVWTGATQAEAAAEQLAVGAAAFTQEAFSGLTV